MAITPAEVEARRRRLEELQRGRSEAQGAIKEQLKRLDKDFGVKNLEELKAKAKNLKAKAERLEAEYREEARLVEEEFDDCATD